MEWLNPAREFLSQVGFPIFVAVWLLYRSDRILSDLTKAIQQLSASLQTQKGE